MYESSRNTLRLHGHDYSQGMYFVTICTTNRELLFGDVEKGEVHLSELGKIASQCWLEIPKHYPHVYLDEFIVMPNHVHGVLALSPHTCNPGAAQDPAPLQATRTPAVCGGVHVHQFNAMIPRSLGSVIRGYKIGVTKYARTNTDLFTVWQRNFYEDIIRNEKHLQHVRMYIKHNPRKWEEDRNNKNGLWL